VFSTDLGRPRRIVSDHLDAPGFKPGQVECVHRRDRLPLIGEDAHDGVQWHGAADLRHSHNASIKRAVSVDRPDSCGIARTPSESGYFRPQAGRTTGEAEMAMTGRTVASDSVIA